VLDWLMAELSDSPWAPALISCAEVLLDEGIPAVADLLAAEGEADVAAELARRFGADNDEAA
jgi:hypothetical protein